MRHYADIIQRFFVVDGRMNFGRGQHLWPKILAKCYPSLLGLPADRILLCIVMRGVRNQAQFAAGGDDCGLDFVEVFCGSAWLTYELLAAGLNGCGFDYVHSSLHNALCSNGLRLILDAICTVRKHGLCWLATPCSSFTVLCRAQSQRDETNHWLGPDNPYEFVTVGNWLAEISSLICFLSYLLSLRFVIEQPTTSCMFQTPSLRGVLFYTHAERYVVYMGSYGGPTVKPLQLYSPWPAIRSLQTERPDLFGAESLVTRSESGSGFTGRKDLLTQSQQYTQDFGKAVANILI